MVSFGARNDGRSDASASFLRTWTVACRSTKPAIIVVPKEDTWILFAHVNRMSNTVEISMHEVLYIGLVENQEILPCWSNVDEVYLSSNIVVSRLTSLNSRMFHFVIHKCKNMKMQYLRLVAPTRAQILMASMLCIRPVSQ